MWDVQRKSVVWTADSTLKIATPETGHPSRVFARRQTSRLALDDDADDAEGGLELRDSTGGRLVRKFKHGAGDNLGIAEFVASPTWEFVASTGADNFLRLRDMRSGKERGARLRRKLPDGTPGRRTAGGSPYVFRVEDGASKAQTAKRIAGPRARGK